MRSRLLTVVALAIYLAGGIALPLLHQRHHARHGADHVHGQAAAVAVGRAHDEAAHHAAFDADLAALGLAEVAHAGALPVDCALAAYTLTACESASPAHPFNFGDELLARGDSAPPPPFDPEHGAGSLEHLRAVSLAQSTFVLLAPLAVAFAPAPMAAFVPVPVAVPTPTSRGPPSVA